MSLQYLWCNAYLSLQGNLKAFGGDGRIELKLILNYPVFFANASM